MSHPALSLYQRDPQRLRRQTIQMDLMMKLQKYLLLLVLITFSQTLYALEEKQFCIYDPIGKNGPAVTFFSDLEAKAIRWGLTLKLVPYTDEKIASNDFKSGLCDMVFLTAILGLPYVPFGGTLGVIGGIENTKQLNILTKSLTNPKLNNYLINGNYEVAGVLPIGAVYMFVNDRTIDTVAEFSGKKMSVLNAAPQAYMMASMVGASPVGTSLATFSGQFNNGVIDLLPMVALSYSAFELYRGLGDAGGILDEKLFYGMMEVISHKDRFEPDFGQKMRNYVLSRMKDIHKLVADAEFEIPSKYWIKTSDGTVQDLGHLKRNVRVALKEKGVLDPKALTLLWKIRCSVNPKHAECVTPE